MHSPWQTHYVDIAIFADFLCSDVKYAQFRQDIHLLGNRLEQLEDVINNANDQGSNKRRQDHALKILPEVTGDFHRTLKDCEILIRRHAALQRSKPGVIANFEWWNSVEPEVSRLRERVKFHITKVSFIAKPFETQLLLGIRDDVRRLILDVDRLTRIVVNGGHETQALESIIIPEAMLRRFNDAFYTNCPACFEESDQWPLKDGFDALVYHFSNSTVGFNSRPELGQNIPEPCQYLNLLKCAWILKHLRNSSNLRKAGADSLWTDYLGRLEEELNTEFSRFNAGQIVAPPHDVVYALVEKFYSIWIEDSSPAVASGTTEQRLFEEKILEISLPEPNPACQSSLTLFRKSDVGFRRVATTKWTDNRYASYAEGYQFDMTSTRFIPSYANPQEDVSDNYNVVLCEEKDQSPTWLSLRNDVDLANLQQALLGYRIHHDMSNFEWCINGEKQNWGQGRLQLWQPKQLSETLVTDVNEPLNRGAGPSPTPQLPEMGFGDLVLMPGVSGPNFSGSETSLDSGRFSDGAVSPQAKNSWKSGDFSVSPQTASPQTPRRPAFIQAFTPPVSTPHEYLASQYRMTSVSQAHRASILSPSLSRQSTSRSDFERQSTRKTSNTVMTRSSVASPISGPRGVGIELIEPELPVLIIFTMCDSRHTFLQVIRKQKH